VLFHPRLSPVAVRGIRRLRGDERQRAARGGKCSNTHILRHHRRSGAAAEQHTSSPLLVARLPLLVQHNNGTALRSSPRVDQETHSTDYLHPRDAPEHHVSVVPIQLRHVLEVHPEQTCQALKWHHADGGNCECIQGPVDPCVLSTRHHRGTATPYSR